MMQTEKPQSGYRFWLVACCILLLAFCLPAAAQTAEESETIRVDTKLVDLNLSVFARDPRRGVGALEQKDFAVFEDGQPQEIGFFASAETPFDLVLLLDLSGSTSAKLDLVRKSAKRFVEATRPVDRIGVVTFTSVSHIVSPLTSNRAELKSLIGTIEKSKLSQGTNFWDALRYVLEKLLDRERGSRRSAVIVMTDGIDNALPGVFGEGSRTDFDELLEIVRRSEAIVLPIYLDTEEETVKRGAGTRGSYQLARQQLAQLAAESGSTVYQARQLEDLKNIYEQVIRDLSTIYSIGYPPRNKQRDGAWRAITVQLINRPDLAVRTKRGYYAK